MEKLTTYSIASSHSEGATAARLLRDRLHHRQIQEMPSEKADIKISLIIDPDLPPESFAISRNGEQNIISGGDWRGLIYGVGKFLHSSKFSQNGFNPSSWKGVSIPARPLRGIYFATHFHNFYHDGPIAEIEHYLEDLALWGVNALMVWFDMHHFNGIGDLAAQAMLQRLREVLMAAKRMGMQTGLGVLANEAYANSPVEMRADWTAGHDGYITPPLGHYHVELCPNKPGAVGLLLKWRREMLEAFRPVGIDLTWIWPYDQGGCTCRNCAPWGSKGFLALAPQVAEMTRQVFPEIKVILSTWYFDHFIAGEWEGLANALEKGADWVDYLLADDYGGQYPPYIRLHGVPGGLPLVGFPEISMYHCTPWGGFGANPLPGYIQSIWEQAKSLQAGGFPYSEGIFEDINKVLCVQLYWGEYVHVDDILREYIAYEYSPEHVDAILNAIHLLEIGNARDRVDPDGTINNYTPWRNHGSTMPRFVMENPAEVVIAANLLISIDRRLPAFSRQAWRWRILLLRAQIDQLLVKSNFEITEACEELFQELIKIYHAQNADFVISPPTKDALMTIREL